MLKKDFIKKDWDTSNAAFMNQNVPLEKIRMNRSARHVSALKYDKYQDTEPEIETTMDKLMTKNSSQRL